MEENKIIKKYIEEKKYYECSNILKRKIIVNIGEFMEIFYILDYGYNDNSEVGYVKLSTFSGLDAFHYVSNSYHVSNGGW